MEVKSSLNYFESLMDISILFFIPIWLFILYLLKRYGGSYRSRNLDFLIFFAYYLYFIWYYKGDAKIQGSKEKSDTLSRILDEKDENSL